VKVTELETYGVTSIRSSRDDVLFQNFHDLKIKALLPSETLGTTQLHSAISKKTLILVHGCEKLRYGIESDFVNYKQE
jgi:hypothetical protein